MERVTSMRAVSSISGLHTSQAGILPSHHSLRPHVVYSEQCAASSPSTSFSSSPCCCCSPSPSASLSTLHPLYYAAYVHHHVSQSSITISARPRSSHDARGCERLSAYHKANYTSHLYSIDDFFSWRVRATAPAGSSESIRRKYHHQMTVKRPFQWRVYGMQPRGKLPENLPNVGGDPLSGCFVDRDEGTGVTAIGGSINSSSATGVSAAAGDADGKWNMRGFAFAPAAESERVGFKETPRGGKLMEETENVGVLLLNLGGPDTLDDVQPFLYNLFADPDIIRLPRLLRFLQKPLAQFISMMRAPKSTEAYASIGGGSPLRKITVDQADALRAALWTKNVSAHTYVGMRYWHPFTEEAIDQIKMDKIARLVVLPLYPQFSISTSGSSLRLLEELFREDEFLVKIKHTVIPSWYQRSGYVESMANLIEKELDKFARSDEVTIFFSAHGVPKAYVVEAGDPYQAEMEECVELILSELCRRGIKNESVLAYQSRVGPVEWLKPYTDETIRELGERGVKSLLAVPISFVSEHIETLEEIDMEYRELAMESGIKNWGRVPALGCYPAFIDDLADAVVEALPYVGAMAASSLEARQALVPLGSVEELLATYDTQRREIPPPMAMWEWGWTKSAETWNGRLAMLAVLGLLLMEVSTGRRVLHWWGILPLLK